MRHALHIRIGENFVNVVTVFSFGAIIFTNRDFKSSFGNFAVRSCAFQNKACFFSSICQTTNQISLHFGKAGTLQS
eukprot:UN17545